ncbi:MAG: hypothetical protein KDI22_09015 [Gammaproteobacteria bacterium]|nr:hypothetical protein [Gammaproteobacteria bacterium]MCB1819275.1 hypothetical protein [Gammaproteobacteria bacterium]MCP5317256.1 hypothetical protein [Chromatiaceae bacterium]MCP5430802.1 hypothetical protein [Chromatiaceae bacterium]
MSQQDQSPSTRLRPLFIAWAGLVLLTLLSVALGEWMRGAQGLLLPVASIIWLKAWLVARYFLEAPLCTTFIRRLIWTFIAFAPIALVLTDLFGRQFAATFQL